MTKTHEPPGAPEKCSDGIDQDCQGGDLLRDRSDNDGDGFYTAVDCNDTNPQSTPAKEDCNYIDEDDGPIDEGNPTGQSELVPRSWEVRRALGLRPRQRHLDRSSPVYQRQVPAPELQWP